MYLETMSFSLPISKIIFLVVVIIFIGVIYSSIKKAARKASQFMNSASYVVDALKNAEIEQEQTPRSLQGMDSLLVPKILKDFPDFNVILAKTKVKDEIRNHLADKKITIHDVAIIKYNNFGIQKVIIFQVSLEYKEAEHKVQKRYDLDYTYMVEGNSDGTHAVANCPNCGAPLKSISSQVCEYCGSPIADVQGVVWKFTDIKES